jgi:glycosyltransferase involved in cell wall biosynthesis
MEGVLILSNVYAPNVGGVETHLTDLTAALARRGWNVNVVSYRPLTTRVGWKRFEREGSVRVWRLWWLGYNWFHILEHYPAIQFVYLVPRLLLGAFWWLLRYGKGVQVIHAHGLAAAFCARVLGPMFRKRVVVSTHAVYCLKAGTWLARAVRWIMAGADRVITLSSQSLQECAEVGIPRSKLGRFVYWVDLDVFLPGDQAEARRVCGVPEGCFVCLFVGRMIAGKGVGLLLEAAASEAMRSVVFVFAGTGPMENAVREAAGARPNIRFAGRVANTSLSAYYRAADVLCVPSQYQEGFGRVIVESLACGTPVLGADCPGIREATSSEVAWLCAPEVKQWSSQLALLAQRPEEVRARRMKCRAFAEEKYSVANVESIESALRGVA